MAQAARRTLDMVPVGSGAYGYRPPPMLPAGNRYFGRGKEVAKRAGRKIAAVAIEKKTEIGMVMDAAGLGLAARFGLGKKIPVIPFLGLNGTVAIGLYGLGRVMKNAALRRAAFGVACIAVYNLCSKGSID